MRFLRGWTELKKRLISGVLLISIFLVCLWYGHWEYDLLILAVMVGIVHECAMLFGQSVKSWRGVLLLLWPFCTGLAVIKEKWIGLLYLAAGGAFFGLRLWGALVVSLLGGGALLYLRSRPDGLFETLFVIASVVGSDSCAYAVGRFFGGPKLAPSISPGKTISGSLGGLVGASFIGGAVAYYGSSHWYVSAFLWAGILGITAQCGDLCESAFKRYLGVKDSGNLIPGHGGLLDRFDGLLFAAPLAALLTLICHYKPLWTLGSW